MPIIIHRNNATILHLVASSPAATSEALFAVANESEAKSKVDSLSTAIPQG
jgi:hypothetical protein